MVIHHCHCGFHEDSSQFSASECVSWFLQNNEVPSDAEASQMCWELIDAQRHLSHLATLETLEASPSQLHDEGDVLRKFIQEFKIALSPVRRLPTELWISIFHLSVSRYAALDMSAGFWGFSQVCARTRLIVLSMPRHWSYIVIDPNDTNNIFPRHAEAILGTYLARSGDADICVNLNVTDSALTPRASALLDILSSAAHRVASLRFTAGCVLCRSLVSWKGRMARLGELNISVAEDLDESGDPKILDVFQDCPSLYDVQLAHFRRSSLYLKLPWSQLNRFSVELARGDKLDGLCEAHNLTNLLVEAPLDSNPLTDMVVLPNLRRLTLYQSATILRHLRVPALQHITYLGPLDSLVGSLSTSLQGSGFGLQELHLITGSLFNDNETMMLLELSRTIRTLIILNRCHSEHTVDRFIAQLSDVRSRETCLLPNLEHLSLDWTAHGSFDKQRFVDAIASRTTDAISRRGISRLRTLWFTYDDNIPPITLDSIETLIQKPTLHTTDSTPGA